MNNRLAQQLRCAQFTAHAYHNRISGPSFFGDHSYLGELYSAYESAYDTLIELSLANQDPLNPFEITHDAANESTEFSSRTSATEMFAALLILERSMSATIEDLLDSEDEASADLGEGMETFLQDLARDSLSRQYKLQQRIA